MRLELNEQNFKGREHVHHPLSPHSRISPLCMAKAVEEAKVAPTEAWGRLALLVLPPRPPELARDRKVQGLPHSVQQQCHLLPLLPGAAGVPGDGVRRAATLRGRASREHCREEVCHPVPRPLLGLGLGELARLHLRPRVAAGGPLQVGARTAALFQGLDHAAQSRDICEATATPIPPQVREVRSGDRRRQGPDRRLEANLELLGGLHALPQPPTSLVPVARLFKLIEVHDAKDRAAQMPWQRLVRVGLHIDLLAAAAVVVTAAAAAAAAAAGAAAAALTALAAAAAAVAATAVAAVATAALLLLPLLLKQPQEIEHRKESSPPGFDRNVCEPRQEIEEISCVPLVGIDGVQLIEDGTKVMKHGAPILLKHDAPIPELGTIYKLPVDLDKEL
mmetsp:Transcript_94932/g.268168  ORF Transcript_94932/g.268168 Transcript_94932/m.268168 type:complete len:392 (+) Transcript_94932:236-1411(+)